MVHDLKSPPDTASSSSLSPTWFTNWQRPKRSGSVPVASLVNHNPQPTFQENGMTYYSQWRQIYPYPCDDLAAERLDLLHSLIYETAMIGQLHNAKLLRKLSSRLRILDIGCGTARWAQAMAIRNPDADVLGIDIGDVDERLEPGCGDNFFFRSGVDFESPDWDDDYQPRSFHLIHCAQLQGAVSDWPKLMRRAYRLLAPGAHMEIIEIDWSPHTQSGVLPQNSHYVAWWDALVYASKARGKSLAVDPTAMGNNLTAAGFDILMHRIEHLDPAESRLPLSHHIPGQTTPHPPLQSDLHCRSREHASPAPPTTSSLSNDNHLIHRRLAGWTRLLVGTPELQFLEGQSMALLSALPNWTSNAVRRLTADATREMNSYGCPIYFKLHIWTAQRPAV